MTGKTRTFVIASLLVLVVGLGTGLVAYYVGLPAVASSDQGPDELRLVPRGASIVAYADVHEIMLSAVRQRVRSLRDDGQQEFQARTGINIETDIDHVVLGVVPETDEARPPAGVVLARGRFEDARIEALMTGHGAGTESYRGTRLLVAPDGGGARGSMSLAFLEPGLVAFGATALVRHAVDLKAGGESVLANDELMGVVRSMDDGNVWAVGRFDALAQGRLPRGLAGQLPPIGWLSVSGQIDSDVRGMVRAEAKDAESAQNLRDTVMGFIALAKLQMVSQPELRGLVDSLSLGAVDKTVTLSFDVPADVIDRLGALRQPTPPQPGSERDAPAH